MSVERRIETLFDNEAFHKIDLDQLKDDPLNFTDTKKYNDRLRDYRNKTLHNDAFVLGNGKIGNYSTITGFMDFDFMGGSMGRAVGSAIVKGAQTAIHQKKPFILFTCSGGARMQEGIISLMQMPRTVASVELLNKGVYAKETHHSTVRIAPALTIEAWQIDNLAESIREVISSL